MCPLPLVRIMPAADIYFAILPILQDETCPASKLRTQKAADKLQQSGHQSTNDTET
jgi:hypothetical protein